MIDKLRIVIAEDHLPSRTLIRGIVETLPFAQIVGEASDGEQLVEIVNATEPDVLLTDIDMPKLNGMAAVKECMPFVPNLKVVFMTAYENFAVEAFNVSAVDYVVKPIEPRRLRQALEKVRRRMPQAALPAGGPSEHRGKLVLRTDRSLHLVPLMDILFIEKVGRKSVVHTLEATLETAETLGTLLGRIGRDDFVQAHRSYIINLGQLSSIVPSGETNLAYFRQYEHPAYISKHKLNGIMGLLGQSGAAPVSENSSTQTDD